VARLLLQVDAALPGRAPDTPVPEARALFDGSAVTSSAFVLFGSVCLVILTRSGEHR